MRQAELSRLAQPMRVTTIERRARLDWAARESWAPRVKKYTAKFRPPRSIETSARQDDYALIARTKRNAMP